MAEIFVHIYLEKEGQICINNVHYFTLSERQKIKLKMNFQDYFLIEYKPINNLQYASFLSKIILKQNSLESESPNIYIVELSANNFYILIIPFRLDIKSKIFSQNNEINKQGKKITFNGEKVEITDKGKFREIEICKTKTNYEMQLINQVLVLFSNEKIKNNMHLINLNNNEHIKLNCDKYQIKENNIQCITNLKTYAKHKKVKIFSTIDLSKKDDFIGYLTHPRENLPQKIIPYAFFQNIFAEDFNLAQKFLDKNSYTTKLNKNVVKGFFGDFESFGTPQINTPKDTISLIYKKNKNIYISRYFTFEMNNENKIINIVEFKPNINYKI